jgi:hypothetical protein
MESTLTFSMLGVRVAEMKGAWVENQHDLAAGLMQVRCEGRIFCTNLICGLL